jgi:ubiquinone/menaquinone biosynthesis C-methylase UbiE
MAGMTTQQLLARLDRADALPGAAELREATYELLRCEPGDRVLDVGCGGGRAVAELCGRGVRAVGADRDPRMLAAARARSAGLAAPDRTTGRVPLPAGGFRAPGAAPPPGGEPSGKSAGCAAPPSLAGELSAAARTPAGESPVAARTPAELSGTSAFVPVAARAPAGESPVAARTLAELSGTSAGPPASARTSAGEPPASAGFVEADLLRLPFGDGEFRGYRADKVLHELADPAAAVAEARRVLAPGGRAVLCGQDWDTLVLDSDRPALTRAIVHARADAIAGPRAARQYRTLLVDAGFTEIAVEVRTMVDTGGSLLPLLDGLAAAARDAGVAADARIDAWLREQSARAAAGRFFLAIPIFVASATAPESPQ